MALSLETIHSCTTQGSFGRGEKYYRQGRVTQLEQEGDRYGAVVVGTDRYEVSLDVATLEGECDCYAFEGDAWCKHIVALALTIADGAVTAAQEPSVKQLPGGARRKQGAQLEVSLTQQPAATLAVIIKKAADRHPDIWDIAERIIAPPVVEQAADVVAAVKQALAPVKKARSWERLTEASVQARDDIASIAERVSPNEESIRGLLQAAVWAYAQLSSIDDPEGELQDGISMLTSRAINLANEHHQWIGLLYEPLAQKIDLPLIEAILEEGDEKVQEDCIQRLDKHLNKRDQALAAVAKEYAEFVLMRHYSMHGDPRLLELLEETKPSQHLKLNALITYHTTREEWRAIVTLLWPLRHEAPARDALRSPVAKLQDHDKLIELYTIDTLQSYDPLKQLTRLEHLLETYNRLDLLPGVVEQLLASKTISAEHKLSLLLKLQRFSEAAQAACTLIATPPQRYAYQYGQPYALIDTITAFADQLTAASPTHALPVWRALFTQEMDRVLTHNNYTRFELFGKRLAALHDNQWLKPNLLLLIEGYPTRKKLVGICEGLVR